MAAWEPWIGKAVEHGGTELLMAQNRICRELRAMFTGLILHDGAGAG